MFLALFSLFLLLASSTASNSSHHESRSSRLRAQASRLFDNVNRLSDQVKRLQLLLAKKQSQENASGGSKPLPPLKRTPEGIAIISDCLDVKFRGLKEDVYFMKPLAQKVVCTHTGEMVVFARTSKSLDVDRLWEDFKTGFGEIGAKKDFFIGMDAMQNYTSSGDKCMSLSLRPIKDSLPSRKLQLSRFVIGPESTKYRLSFYKYDRGLPYDVFSYHNGRPFATKDNLDPYKCAVTYVSANWFSHCYHINLFGRYNYTKSNVDGFASRGLDKSCPSTFQRLHSAVMTLRKVGGDPQALKSVYYVPSPSCPARVGEWMAPETGEYLITAGGAPGGRAPHRNAPSGGRGALVKIRALLKKGTRLRFVVGCRGGVGYLSGDGGDGTFVADLTRRKLLAAAGGGGGGGWISGGHGRASANGGKARLTPGVTSSVLTVAANDWKWIEPKIFGGIGGVASSGGLTLSDKGQHGRGGGGGGGFKGGWAARDGGLQGERQAPKHSAGGGGGSACNEELAESCEMKAGGNAEPRGVLHIEAYNCF